jgi:hypothetical protein
MTTVTVLSIRSLSGPTSFGSWAYEAAKALAAYKEESPRYLMRTSPVAPSTEVVAQLKRP